MPQTEIWQRSATALAAAFRAGTLRPSEALAAILARIEAANPVVNAFAQLDTDGARYAAAEADAHFAAGTPRGAFDGIPVSIKDNITVAGLRCAWGSEVYRDFVPEADETPVVRQRARISKPTRLRSCNITIGWKACSKRSAVMASAGQPAGAPKT